MSLPGGAVQSPCAKAHKRRLQVNSVDPWGNNQEEIFGVNVPLMVIVLGHAAQAVHRAPPERHITHTIAKTVKKVRYMYTYLAVSYLLP